MTPQGHLVRILKTGCLGMLVILSAFALPVREMNAQTAETPGGELFNDDVIDSAVESTDPKAASKPVGETEQASQKPRTKLTPDEKVEMTTEGQINLSVQDLDLRMVLRQISQRAKMNIVVSKSVEGTISLDLYGVTVKEAIQAILKSNNLVSVEEGIFIYVYTAQEFADLRKMEYRVFRLYYIKAEDAEKLIQYVLSTNGKVATTPAPEEGIVEPPELVKDWGSAQDYASQGIMIVRDYPENLEKIKDILDEIDVKPDQVLIEATILAANLDETNALGIDLQVLAGVDFQTFGVTSDLTGITVPPPLLGGGVKDFNHAQGRLATPFTNNFPPSSNPMTIGFINNNVGVFLRALEGITDTTVLANPKLLVMNKQRGDILVGNEDGYITTTISQTVATETVEFLETGTVLRVRPFIGKNGDVRMELFVEISRGQVEQLTEGGPALPSKSTTKYTSNVTVRDGKTIFIAGLFRDQMIIQRNQTPVLGNLPLIGQLFRSTVDTTIREEIIILLTPHIIESESAELASERIRDDMERTRAGVRKGLQWFSRSKLADTHIRWARKDTRNGNLIRAMWNVDIALSLEPKMIDAIRLKERLTHEAYWADQPAFMSTRTVIRRMIMQELGKPYEKVGYPRKPLDANKLFQEERKRFGIGNRKHLPLSWPDPSPVKVEHQEMIVEPAPKPKVDEPVDEAAEEVEVETVEEPAPQEKDVEKPVEIQEEMIVEPAPKPKVDKPIEEPAEKVEIETVEEPAPQGKNVEKPVEEPASKPTVDEPVKEPTKNSEVQAVKPAAKQSSADVYSPEPDFGPEVKDEPGGSVRPALKKIPKAKAGNKIQKKPTERKLRKSLVEELQRKNNMKFSSKASVSPPGVSKPTTRAGKIHAKPMVTRTKTSTGSQLKSKKTVLQPAQIPSSSAAKPAVKPAPTSMPADNKIGWVEPRPLSEVLQGMARK